MALRRVSFQSILNGEQTQFMPSGDGTYLQGLGIDPDMPINAEEDGTTSGVNLAGGAITPVSYTEFSDDINVNATPMWIIRPVGENRIYTYLNNGKIFAYSQSFGTQTQIGTALSNASGNGAAYYAGYIYFATDTDIARYDLVSTLTSGVWTAATLGSQTALTNTTYPRLTTSTYYPNHPMHAHVDNKLYIGDYKDGRGLIHFIKTTATGGTNDGSTYNALELPQGYIPTDIESYGNDLVISAMYNLGSGELAGIESALFFWDTLSDSFYRKVDISETAVTALLNVGGVIYAFGGNMGFDSVFQDNNVGCVVLRYLGGYSIEQVDFLDFGYPPPAGAIDSYGSRISFGSATIQPEKALAVVSLGSRHRLSNARNVTGKIRTGSDLNVVTALKYVSSNATTNAPVVGWQLSDLDGSNAAYGLSNFATSNTNGCYLRSEVVHVDKKFRIAEMRITLGKAVESTTNIEVYIAYDTANGETANRVQLPTINNTNYSGKREITYKGPTLTKAASTIGGTPLGFTPTRDFFIEFKMVGDNTSVMLPIEIIIDTIEE